MYICIRSNGYLLHSIYSHHTDVPLQDCKALKNEQSLTSGLYKIYPGDKEGEFTTFCDMQLSGDGEGWTVIQRRVDGGTLFNRTWAEYENGFGDLNENFWLGLRKIQRITDMGTHELFIGLEDKLHRTAHAVYRDFNLGSPHYKLIVGAYDESRSTAQDSLKEHNMQPFSTIDIDHDAATNAHCAHQHQGGWWYHSCVHSNLNGVYHASGSASGKNDGIVWKDWLGDYNVAISTIMAVRRVS